MADVSVLAPAIAAHYKLGGASGDQRLISYSETCLRRVWRVQRFSSWMTTLLHRFSADTEFEARRQLAELEYLVSSRAAMTSLALLPYVCLRTIAADGLPSRFE